MLCSFHWGCFACGELGHDSSALPQVGAGGWAGSGYHHIDIADVHEKYLGFCWDRQFYVFTVLPFGLATACYIFTKVVRPLVRYWRSRGLRILVYLDDGLCAVTGKQATVQASQLVKTTIEKAGFVAHPKKSVWEPTQRLVWLGFIVDA